MIRVAGKGTGFPEMLAQPGAAHLENAPYRTAANGSGLPPDIGVVMGGPAAHAIEVLRDMGAVHTEFLGEIDQGQMALGEIRRLDGPVIDLRVAIECPVRRPRRVDLMIPNALQIRWLRPRPRRGDQQVAAELIVYCRQ
jgi:hypothetical protein